MTDFQEGNHPQFNNVQDNNLLTTNFEAKVENQKVERPITIQQINE